MGQRRGAPLGQAAPVARGRGQPRRGLPLPAGWRASAGSANPCCLLQYWATCGRGSACFCCPSAPPTPRPPPLLPCRLNRLFFIPPRVQDEGEDNEDDDEWVTDDGESEEEEAAEEAAVDAPAEQQQAQQGMPAEAGAAVGRAGLAAEEEAAAEDAS